MTEEMEVSMSDQTLADAPQLNREVPVRGVTNADIDTLISVVIENFNGNGTIESKGQPRISASGSSGPPGKSAHSPRTRGDFQKNQNPLKDLSRWGQPIMKVKKLTDRRKKLITKFLEDTIDSSNLYGKVGTKRWAKELICSLDERKHQRTNFVDIRSWFNEKTYFKDLLDRIPEWQEDSWLRSGYKQSSPPSNPDRALNSPTPANSDSGVGSMEVLSNESGTDASFSGMRSLVVAEPSSNREQKIRIRPFLPPPPPLIPGPRRALALKITTPADTFMSEGQFLSVSRLNMKDVGNVTSISTLASVEQSNTQVAFVKSNKTVEQAHHSNSGNANYNWSARTGDGNQSGGHQREGSGNLPTLPQADALLNNYTNAMFNMVKDMKTLGTYGSDNSINWDVCYHALKILILTTHKRN